MATRIVVMKDGLIQQVDTPRISMTTHATSLSRDSSERRR